LYRRTGTPAIADIRLRQEKHVGVLQEFDLQPYRICKMYLKGLSVVCEGERLHELTSPLEYGNDAADLPGV
jgi:hypothetical protein